MTKQDASTLDVERDTERAYAALSLLSSRELLTRALTDPWMEKVIARILEERPPDPATSEALCEILTAGGIEPYLAAHLLGCLRAPQALPALHEIIVTAPGALAESYAVDAMLKIAGAGARADLLRLIESPHNGRCRKAARDGLIALHDPTLASELFERVCDGRITSRSAAEVLRTLVGPDSTLLTDWLSSQNAGVRSVALRILAAAPWAAAHLATAVEAALASEHDLAEYLQQLVRRRLRLP